MFSFGRGVRPNFVFLEHDHALNSINVRADLHNSAIVPLRDPHVNDVEIPAFQIWTLAAI